MNEERYFMNQEDIYYNPAVNYPYPVLYVNDMHAPDIHPGTDRTMVVQDMDLLVSPTNISWSPMWSSPNSIDPNQHVDKYMNDISLETLSHFTKQELIQRLIQLESEKQQEPPEPLDVCISNQEELHVCHWHNCNMILSTLDELIQHMKDIHMGHGKTAYYCQWKYCPRGSKPFFKRHKMQNHMRTHTGEKPFECTVQDCDKRFSRLDSLNTHIKTHSTTRSHPCPIESCSKAYFHTRSLRKHLNIL